MSIHVYKQQMCWQVGLVLAAELFRNTERPLSRPLAGTTAKMVGGKKMGCDLIGYAADIDKPIEFVAEIPPLWKLRCFVRILDNLHRDGDLLDLRSDKSHRHSYSSH